MNSKAILGIIVIIVLVGGYVLFSKSPEMTQEATVNLEGLHIMTDGTVMLGSGEMLEGAEATGEGMVMLKSGEMLENVTDMRIGDSIEEMEHMDSMEGESMEAESHDHDDGSHEHE